MAALYVRQLELGPMQNFCYLVGDQDAGRCVVVDPAWEIDAIVEQAEADGVRIEGAVISHSHPDHVGGRLFGTDIPGVEDLLERVPDARVYVHKAEREFMPGGLAANLVRVEGGTELPVGGLTVTFIHTPGHTPGSQCFYVDGRLLSGDTLFINACGRTDLPGGDPAEMHRSLTQRLAKLPDETVLLPGHNYGGPSSTIGDEKRQNPFMRIGLADFLRTMGGGRIVLP
jgi:glyoxylase-like metal-dependent hydrolase (beta-lactamase superfamily II)